MVPIAPASSAASRSAAWLWDNCGSVDPLGKVHLLPPLVLTREKSNPVPRRGKKIGAPCSGKDFPTGAEPMRPPVTILYARYFTSVNVQRKMCIQEGYERVTSRSQTAAIDGNGSASHVFCSITCEPL